MSVKLFTIIAAAGLMIMAGTAAAQNDPIGKVDTVTLYIENLEPGKWMISAHVWNDEEIAAIDIPIRYTAGIARVKVDSVSYTGTRMQDFAVKQNPVEDTLQIMHFGGFAYMGPNKPPMPAGSGEVARIYFSAVGGRKPELFAADTTTAPPNNTLMLVDKNAKIIIPALKIIDKQPTAKPKEAEKQD